MDVILSIKPNYTQKIYEGSKRVELRKKIGKGFEVGSKVLIYTSSPVKAIEGEAFIESINLYPIKYIQEHLTKLAGISENDLLSYFEGCNEGYAIKLNSVNQYDNPVSLNELKKIGFHPPQSFCYLTKELKKRFKTLEQA